MGDRKRHSDDIHKSPSEITNPDKMTTRLRMSCKVCKEPVSLEFEDEESFKMKCVGCGDRFHGPCLGITSTFFYNMINGSKKGWFCYNCNQDRLHKVQTLDEKFTLLSKTVEAQTKQLLNFQQLMNHGFDVVQEKVDEVIQVKINDIDKRMSDEFDAMRQRLLEYEKKLSNIGMPLSNPVPHSKLPTNSDITYIKDLQRKTNLVIQNIPSLINENQNALKNLITKVASTCGTEIDPSDIASVIRLRKRNSPGLVIDPHKALTHDSILVKFTDVSIKDEIFRGYIQNLSNKIFLTTSGLGLAGNTRVYINQHLSPELIRIKMKAVKLKESKVLTKVSACYNVVRVLYKGNWHKIFTMDQLTTLTTETEPMSNDLLF